MGGLLVRAYDKEAQRNVALFESLVGCGVPESEAAQAVDSDAEPIYVCPLCHGTPADVETLWPGFDEQPDEWVPGCLCDGGYVSRENGERLLDERGSVRFTEEVIHGVATNKAGNATTVEMEPERGALVVH